MIRLFSRFLCKIGKHNWLYDSDKHTANRCCRRCNKWQHPVYDLTYGDTYYVAGYYQYNQLVKERRVYDVCHPCNSDWGIDVDFAIY